MPVQQYDIFINQQYVGTVMSTLVVTPINYTAVVAKLQVAEDSAQGIGTITVKLYSTNQSGQQTLLEVITVTPSSPIYIEQQYEYGVIRIPKGSSLTAVTESGTVSITIDYYYLA